MKQKLEPKPNLIYGIILTVIAYFCFSITSACVKALNNNIPTIEIIFMQNVISIICLAPFFFKKGAHSLKTKFYWIHLVRDISVLLNTFLCNGGFEI